MKKSKHISFIDRNLGTKTYESIELLEDDLKLFFNKAHLDIYYGDRLVCEGEFFMQFVVDDILKIRQYSFPMGSCYEVSINYDCWVFKD